MKKLSICILAFLLLATNATNIRAQAVVEVQGSAYNDVRLKNKIVPLSNPVYQILDHYETTGAINFLPQAKPYTKIYILTLLDELTGRDDLSQKEKSVIDNFRSDFLRESNGVQLYKDAGKNNSFGLLGFAAELSARAGIGDDGSWGTSNTALPYLSGDLGNHLSFHAAMGASVEKLSPDLFYQSYTKDQRVNFPYQSIGYASLPYQFNYESLYTHSIISDKSAGHSNITKEMAIGLIYFTELNGSWYDGALQISLNNQRRAWGNDRHNLVLSSDARRFPAFEFKVAPNKWFRYSFLTGSLFSYANQRTDYKKEIYGYDLGDSQNLFTLHLLELTPFKWLQISASAANIWSKRFELSYLMPFVFPHFSELEVGDYDNSTMAVDVAVRIPKVGKTWLSFFNDEFSFSESGPLLKMPRNRYAWQLGIKSPVLSALIPGTSTILKYTRVTPFAYTHYPDTRFNTFTSRPLDMTYTNDGFNLGFYLPPNSGELLWSVANIAIPDVVLSLDTRLIMHGTNDLASDNIYQIYGDVYRHQYGDDIYKYPLLDFTKDGIYDWTVSSELKFDWKLRNSKHVRYYRIVGSLGYSKTWWRSNNSQVVAPSSKTLFVGSLGLVADI